MISSWSFNESSKGISFTGLVQLALKLPVADDSSHKVLVFLSISFGCHWFFNLLNYI